MALIRHDLLLETLTVSPWRRDGRIGGEEILIFWKRRGGRKRGEQSSRM